MNRDVKKAARLYRQFREVPPQRARSVRIKLPKAVAVLGTVEFVGYVTTHRGKTHLYIHEFSPASRPLMCAGTGAGQMFFIGGRYKVTARGIVDYDSNGRETHAQSRYEVKQRT